MKSCLSTRLAAKAVLALSWSS